MLHATLTAGGREGEGRTGSHEGDGAAGNPVLAILGPPRGAAGSLACLRGDGSCGGHGPAAGDSEQPGIVLRPGAIATLSRPASLCKSVALDNHLASNSCMGVDCNKVTTIAVTGACPAALHQAVEHVCGCVISRTTRKALVH
jgi:hypothetical protein